MSSSTCPLSHTQVLSQLGGEDLPIKEIHAIYNPSVVASFSNYRKILKDRFQHSPMIFKKSWEEMEKDEQKKEARGKTAQHFQEKISLFSWNSGEDLPLLVTLHGTDFKNAQTIASSNFAGLSLQDAGWYGRGIYFTTSVEYSLCYVYFCFPKFLLIFPETQNPSRALFCLT
jgi:hypothetical protein